MAIDNQDQSANPAAPKKVKAAERRIMALELRKQGGSYRVIAAQLRKMQVVGPGYNESAAYKDCMAALHSMIERQDELARENLRLDLERLDEILTGVYTAAKKGDTFSINAVFGVLDRRGRLLNYAGLAPQQNLNIDVTQLTDDQLERIANGEDPISVLARSGKSGVGAQEASSE